jgi:hypothetical protein
MKNKSVISLMARVAALLPPDRPTPPARTSRRSTLSGGRQLMEKSSSGATLTAEEQAYLERVKQAIRERNVGAKQSPAQTKAARAPVNPADWSGLVAITDLAGPYKGEDGGLYGGGRNEPPAAHRRETDKIRPLDAQGNPAADGKIGLITIGFSNSSMESEDFKRTADADPQKSPPVVIVNGCIGGRSAVMWAWDGAESLPKSEQDRLDQQMDLLRMPKTNRKSVVNTSKDTWPTLAQRLAAAGLSPLQVQPCWLKHVEANPKPLGEFPAHARALLQCLATRPSE